MTRTPSLRSLSDDELLMRLSEMARRARRAEADLVAHIGEVDRRRLYRREATTSMFAYCTERLHLSEHEAYLRIAVARAAREHPILLTMLADGRLHLSAIDKLAPHLTPENRDELLLRATHRSKREVEELVAELAPKADARTVVRKLPEPKPTPAPAPDGPARPAGPPQPARLAGPLDSAQLGPGPVEPRALTSPPKPPVVEPLAPARYKVQFTASAALRDKLERLQALLPGSDLADAIEQAVSEKLERLEARRFAKTSRPRKALAEADTSPASRYVPAPVRRAVHSRDGGRCTYVDAAGRRCTARKNLEFHHEETPFGRGGDHSVANLRLLCHPHNALMAERDYGPETMARHRRSPTGVTEARGLYSCSQARRIAPLLGSRGSAAGWIVERPPRPAAARPRGASRQERAGPGCRRSCS
jgi:hypothetical protein